MKSFLYTLSVVTLVGMNATAAFAETQERTVCTLSTACSAASVPFYYDNATTYPVKSQGGSTYKRYVYTGDIQKCSKYPGGKNDCTATFGKEVSKEISNGVEIDVQITYGGDKSPWSTSVRKGYSWTLTKGTASSWSASRGYKLGYSARPVSYIVRYKGTTGDAKNSLHFVRRDKRSCFTHTPPRPVTTPIKPVCTFVDVYERKPQTVSGSWKADTIANNGASVSEWIFFKGDVDPNIYVRE